MERVQTIYRSYHLDAYWRPGDGYIVRITHKNGGKSVTTTTFAEIDDALDSARRIVDLFARTLH